MFDPFGALPVLLPEVLEEVLVFELDDEGGVSTSMGKIVMLLIWPPLLKPMLITLPLADSPTRLLPLND